MGADKITIEPGLEFDAANVQHPMARQASAGSPEHLEFGGAVFDRSHPPGATSLQKVQNSYHKMP